MWAADAGRDADRYFDDLTGNDTIGDIAGGVTTAGMSIAAVPGVIGGAIRGAGSAAGSAVYGAGSAAVSFIGGIFSW